VADNTKPEILHGPAADSQNAVSPDAGADKAPEISTPMYDVHAPHGAVHSWKDFFIHIAAIACGLVLALALEKTAEYLHQRHLLSEARSVLAAELEDNRRAWQKNAAEVQRMQRELKDNLRVIQALRSHALPAGKLDYSANLYATLDGAWQSVHQNGALSLMPQTELTKEAWFYRLMLDLLDAIGAFNSTMKIAAANAANVANASPEQLDTRQLDELTSKTIEAQGRLDYVQMFLDIEERGIDELVGASRGKGAGK